jgi:NADH-quinone oxidoreductase subunit H
MSALMVTLFLGGWTLPFVEIPTDPGVGAIALSVLIFCGKLTFLLFFFIWVRWTLPRFRYDQLMQLGWKVLIPISLANLGLTALGGVLGWDWLIPLPW